MVSTPEPAGGLLLVERARGHVWAAYFSSWTWYAGAALLVTFGLMDDFAPDWSGLYFLVVASLILVVGLFGMTRRGKVLLRMSPQPRSAVLGTGHRGTRRSQALLAAVRATTIVLVIALAVVVFVSVQGGDGQHAAAPVPSTVLYTAMALACIGISLIGRRWAQRKITGHVHD